MNIYHYDPASGLLIGPGIADQDPMDAENWLIPAHATTDEPLPAQDGKTVNFIEGAWAYVDVPQPAPEPEAPAPTLQDKLATVRGAREAILNRLSGIALAASLTGDTATTAAYILVRNGLLNITAGLTDVSTMDAIVVQRYTALVAECTPALVSAFAQVDS